MDCMDMEEQLGTQTRRKRRFPWICVCMVCVYLGLGAALTVYEINAHRILSKGQHAEATQRYQTASLAYMMVIEKFPLSFGVIEAKTGLDRIEPALADSPLPDRLNTSWMERDWGEEFNPYFMDWLPFFASFACGTMLFLVFVTRIRRGGMAFWAFLLLCTSAFLAAIQLARYGWLDQAELRKLADGVFAERMAVYVGAYVLMGMTVLLTLSRMTRPIDAAEATDREDDEHEADRHHTPATAPSPLAAVSSDAQSSITSRLRRLQELQEQGLISEHEMQQRRQEILSEV